ncbi:hypothetical protein SAMN05443144_11692 [Fodinibius roseus]|uniref:Uncharacterized protein n=1 Tax=Fodinibius roseus TaxID=1194090 RepID=A0A1M5G5M2_9BACT|nr:hypothetical protein SAMN05443144_11692 [Fodinibius roseus]
MCEDVECMKMQTLAKKLFYKGFSKLKRYEDRTLCNERE